MKGIITLFIIGMSIGTVTEFNDWELVKSRNGIHIYQKEIGGSRTPAFKGEMELQISSEKVFYILRDIKNYINWLPMVDGVEIIEQNDAYAIAYVTVDSPWPVSDRDGFFEYRFSPGDLMLKVKSLDNYEAEKKGYVRIKNSNSSWKLIDLTGNKCKVVYESHTELATNIPQWLIKSKLVSIPFESLLELRKQLEN